MASETITQAAADGPFHVSRSSDGEKEWYSARDPAAGVTIPAKCRDDAYAMASSLNRSALTFRRAAVAELVECLVKTAIPLEAMILSGTDKQHCNEVRNGIHEAVKVIRNAISRHQAGLGKGDE